MVNTKSQSNSKITYKSVKKAHEDFSSSLFNIAFIDYFMLLSNKDKYSITKL